MKQFETKIEQEAFDLKGLKEDMNEKERIERDIILQWPPSSSIPSG